MLQFKLITPEKVVTELEAVSITVPTTSGEVTILPGHIPLVTEVGHGHLIVRSATGEHDFAVSSGFLTNQDNTVELLAESAIHADEIDLQLAEEARKRAEQLREAATGELEIAEATVALERALAQLKVANRKRKHHL